MATVTKDNIALEEFNRRPLPAVDLGAHQRDLARRAAEREARCPLEERLKLCNPKYAAEVESKKPVYRWKVKFNVIERKPTAKPKADKYADDDVDEEENKGDWKFRSCTKIIEAQNEDDAWAMVCDKMQEWPSRKTANPRFTRLKDVDK
jgi:hypothetical protein